jgi:hypothetical protein
MENREQQILSEIKTMMASIRIQLEKLDAKMAELQQVVDPEDLTAMPIDLEIDDIEMVEQPVEVLEEDDLPFVETPVEAPVEVPVEVPVVETVIEEPVVEEPVVEEPVVEPVVEEAVEEPAVEPTAPEEEPVTVEEEPETAEEEDDDDLPLFAEPKPIFEAAQDSPKVKKAVIDVMTNKEAWRTDMAGSPVRDLLSAISLNDRVQFINVLFDEDPVKFQQTRAKINAMTSLDDVVEFITANFNWDMSSQVVYRFMMAVRRKVQA